MSDSSVPPPPGESPKDLSAAGTAMSGLWILAVALGVRIVYFLQYASSPLMGDLQADQLYYFEWARRIAAGDWAGQGTFERGPLYAYAVGALFTVVGDDLTLTYLAQMLLGCITCLLVWASARRLWGPGAAVVAGLLAATYGPFVFQECQFMKSFLNPLLTAVVAYATIRFRESNGRGWLVLCGTAIGLAALEREVQGLLILPAAWYGAWAERPGVGRLRRAADVAILGAASAMCLVPSTARNLAVTGQFVIVTSGGGEAFYTAHGPQAQAYYAPPDFVPAHVALESRVFREEAMRRTGREMTSGECSRYWFREALHQIASDPVAEVRRSVLRLLLMFDDFEVPDSEDYAATCRFVPLLRWLPHFGWISAWGWVGTLACLVVPDLRRGRVVVAFAAVHVLSVVITYNLGRFRLGLVVPWILLAVMAWWVVLVALRSAEPRRRRAGLCGAALGVALTGAVALRWHPAAYDVTESVNVARLALREGDHALAATESRALLGRLSHLPLAGASAQQVSVVAQSRTMLGEAYLGSGAIDAARAEFRAALALPLVPSLREGFLRQYVDLMQDRLEQLDRAASRDGPAESLRAARGEFALDLARLAPDQPAFWGLAAAGDPTDAVRQEIAAGLTESWNRLEEPTREDRGWYEAGRAFLAARAGHAAEARRAARAARAAWPEHVLGDELPE